LSVLIEEEPAVVRSSSRRRRAPASVSGAFSFVPDFGSSAAFAAKVRKTFDDGGMDLFPPDQQMPEAASALLKREIKLWGDVIRANNISAQ
jgi:hypothetical protein